MINRDLRKNREQAARLQRQRRERMIRIDYMPSAHALAAIGARRAQERPGSVAATNSAVISAILEEWVELVGLRKHIRQGSKTQSRLPARPARPELPVPSQARACAYDSGTKPELGDQYARARMTSAAVRLVACGATRHRDGNPCQAKGEPGKRRCRFHGGRSTGPVTPEGKKRALANLRQNRHGRNV
jgi:hypothetical protein